LHFLWRCSFSGPSNLLNFHEFSRRLFTLSDLSVRTYLFGRNKFFYILNLKSHASRLFHSNALQVPQAQFCLAQDTSSKWAATFDRKIESLFIEKLLIEGLWIVELLIYSVFIESLFIEKLLKDRLWNEELLINSLLIERLLTERLLIESMLIKSWLIERLFTELLRVFWKIVGRNILFEVFFSHAVLIEKLWIVVSFRYFESWTIHLTLSFQKCKSQFWIALYSIKFAHPRRKIVSSLTSTQNSFSFLLEMIINLKRG
jgi:hypothetical protein